MDKVAAAKRNPTRQVDIPKLLFSPADHGFGIFQTLRFCIIREYIGCGKPFCRLQGCQVNFHAALSVHAVYIVFQLLNLTGHQQAILLLGNCGNLKNGWDLPCVYCNQVAGLDRRIRLINLYGAVVNKLRNDTRIKNKNVFLEVELAVVVAVHLGALSCGQAIRQNGILFCRRYLLIRAEISAGKGNPSPLHCNLRSRRIGALGLVRKTDTALALEAHQGYSGFRRKVPGGRRVRLKRGSFCYGDQAVSRRYHNVIVAGAVFRDVAVIIVRILRFRYGQSKRIHHRTDPIGPADHNRTLRFYLHGRQLVLRNLEQHNRPGVLIGYQASVLFNFIHSYRNRGGCLRHRLKSGLLRIQL